MCCVMNIYRKKIDFNVSKMKTYEQQARQETSICEVFYVQILLSACHIIAYKSHLMEKSVIVNFLKFFIVFATRHDVQWNLNARGLLNGSYWCTVHIYFFFIKYFRAKIIHKSFSHPCTKLLSLFYLVCAGDIK